MPFCSKCGTEVAEGINFCGKCGNALNSTQSPRQTNYAESDISDVTPFAMEKNMLFRIIGKLGYIFVVIGFCMPIACDHNGFEIAEYMFDYSKAIFGLLTILMFITAVIGIIIGIVQLTNKNVKNITIDWITTISCIGSGLIVYLGCFVDDKYIKLQSGAYVILIGWIIALVGQIISTSLQKKSLECSNQKSTANGNRLFRTIAVIIKIFVVVVVLEAAVAYLLTPKPKSGKNKETKQVVNSLQMVAVTSDAPIDAQVTLAGTDGERYLKAKIILEYDGKNFALGIELRNRVPQFKNLFINYLANITLAEASDPGARDKISKDMLRIINNNLPAKLGEVNNVLFTDFVIQ